jgi:hypothetical protein
MALVSLWPWRLAGDALNITFNLLCCNHQLHRDFWSPGILKHTSTFLFQRNMDIWFYGSNPVDNFTYRLTHTKYRYLNVYGHWPSEGTYYEAKLPALHKYSSVVMINTRCDYDLLMKPKLVTWKSCSLYVLSLYVLCKTV